ncbi:hypothetical protein [Streptomyces sp. STR69]|uniref:hypothetical protein n=1 Tax=Streptomyces sp. STR69 TaxID=1796942 RepID=UPI0021C9682B|nr:hypothetical protein [Streptomyces sp. STR69]
MGNHLTNPMLGGSLVRRLHRPEEFLAVAALEPVLPPGQKISVEKRAADVSARDVATSALAVDPNEASADNGQLVCSKTGAVAKSGACPG